MGSDPLPHARGPHNTSVVERKLCLHTGAHSWQLPVANSGLSASGWRNFPPRLARQFGIQLAEFRCKQFLVTERIIARLRSFDDDSASYPQLVRKKGARHMHSSYFPWVRTRTVTQVDSITPCDAATIDYSCGRSDIIFSASPGRVRGVAIHFGDRYEASGSGSAACIRRSFPGRHQTRLSGDRFATEVAGTEIASSAGVTLQPHCETVNVRAVRLPLFSAPEVCRAERALAAMGRGRQRCCRRR